ncbi:hypothetical protein ACQ86N_36040 [Puia sp. P3]|uniref:hypothetical protein n=1 Tax=Puia sp. P3 TaxID=3423952 RepID=UPI003D676B4B
MKDLPENSSIKFNVAFNFQQLEKEFDTTHYWKSLNSSWGQFNYDTYLLLKPNTNTSNTEQQLADIHRRNEKDDFTKHLSYVLNHSPQASSSWRCPCLTILRTKT